MSQNIAAVTAACLFAMTVAYARADDAEKLQRDWRITHQHLEGGTYRLDRPVVLCFDGPMSFENVTFDGYNMDKSFARNENKFYGMFSLDYIHDSHFIAVTFIQPKWEDYEKPPHAPALITLKASDKCVAPVS